MYLKSSASGHRIAEMEKKECMHTEHLIRLTETESQLILMHELAVLLGSLGPHFGCF